MTFDNELIQSLEEFGRILSREPSHAPDSVAFCQDKEVDRLVRHVDRAEHGSILLVGPAGCGKTTVLKQLFRQLATRKRKPWLVLETSTTQIFRGTAYLGEWQTRVHELIELAQRSKRVAVFFTDIANLVAAGRWSKSDENMAKAMVPYLESGHLLLIGECDEDTFRLGIEPFPWFHKLFTCFQMRPPEGKVLEEIIRKVAESRAHELQRNHGLSVEWTDGALAAVERFGSQYFPSIAPPGGAVRLIEYLSSKHGSNSSTGTRRKPPPVEVGRDDVVRNLAALTGIPARLLDDSLPLDIEEVKQFFAERVLGQSDAVTTVVDVITLLKAGLNDPKKPLSVLLFVGPTGVGKTEMVKALAEYIFGNPDRMVRFDMSEFKDYNSFEKLIGDPQAAERTAMRAGSLLSHIRRQPFSVILLDEIEKAHGNIYDLLLQLFDDGRLSDPAGKTTDFTQTIVVMTSNLGGEISEGGPLALHSDKDPSSLLEDAVMESLRDFFRPELLNRIDNIVMFRPLGRQHIHQIAQRELGRVLMRSGITRRQLRVDVDAGVIDILADAGFDHRYGARPLKRAVERLALLPIARQLVKISGDERPALLRLVPAGNRIRLSIVHDRQARRSESLAHGVTVTDPIRGKKIRVKPAQLKSQLRSLDEAVGSLENEVEARDLAGRKTELVGKTSQVDFWDHPPAARETLSDLYRIERLLEAIDRVRRRTNDLDEYLDKICRNGSETQLIKAAETLRQIQQHRDLIQYSLTCPSRLGRCDAFVDISTVDDPNEDLAGKIADMYLGWARHKGFRARTVHEELSGPKSTRHAILLVEGVTIYGLLCGEQGLHEFVYGKTSKSAKRTEYVKVGVLPITEEVESRTKEVDVKAEKSHGKGLRCKKYQSLVRAVHRPTHLEITAHSDLASDEAADVVCDLLVARRLWIDQRAQCSDGPDVQEDEEIVRRYTLSPNQIAKDYRTGVSTRRLGDLWKGDLDAFLLAASKNR